MPSQRKNRARVRIAIVGGGVAGLEAMLSFRALFAPHGEFVYRPFAAGEPFGDGRGRVYDLEQLTAIAGVALRIDSVFAVDPEPRRIVTGDGEESSYDYLLVASGAEKHAAFPGAVTFWGRGAEGGAEAVARGLLDGEFSRPVFTAPASSWPLPPYELALLADSELRRAGVEGARLTILTPEDAPLRLFGPQASEWVAGLLAELGIETILASQPLGFEDGLLRIDPGEPLESDAVVSVPRLEGRRLAGLPSDPDGFIPIDGHSRVLGLDRVFAIGDVSSFPIKQTGVAAQQAGVAAATIAAEVLGEEAPRPFDPILRATLWTGERPQYLYSHLTGGHGETSIVSERALWEHEDKIAGQHLTPLLDAIPGAGRPESRPEASGAEPVATAPG